MAWSIQYLKEALKDLKKLDPSVRRLVLKAIEKTAERPLPPPDASESLLEITQTQN